MKLPNLRENTKVLISKQDRGYHLGLCKHQKDKGNTTNKPTKFYNFYKLDQFLEKHKYTQVANMKLII